MPAKQEIKQNLSAETVKQYEGFENISDKEAEQVANTLREFSLLTYLYFTQQQKKTIH